MFTVPYTVKIVYICVFMTHSTSYCLCDTHMDPVNVHMYVCMYVCMHECTYICVCVCMYACTHVCRYVSMYVNVTGKCFIFRSRVQILT